MIEVQGDFDAGSVVEIVDTAKTRIAVGQVGFSSEDAKLIIQKNSAQIKAILPHIDEKSVMVHRDEMAIL